MKQEYVKTNGLKTYLKRFELITVARFRDKTKIKRASERIDEIRKKIGKGEGKTMTEIIRKWRDTRYGPSSA